MGDLSRRTWHRDTRAVRRPGRMPRWSGGSGRRRRRGWHTAATFASLTAMKPHDDSVRALRAGSRTSTASVVVVGYRDSSASAPGTVTVSSVAGTVVRRPRRPARVQYPSWLRLQGPGVRVGPAGRRHVPRP